MILGLGLMVSVYFSFLILPGSLSAGISKLKNHFISRVAILAISIYLLFIIDSLMHWQGDIVFMDGLCKINPYILTSEIYILILALIIIHLQGIYFRRPELYLFLLSNIIGFIYLISSNDWLITVTAWELFNLSLYLIVCMNSESEAALSAAIKYFLLSALGSTFLLLAIGLLYALTGTTHYDNLSLSIPSVSETSLQWPLLLMVITFLFKVGAVPFYNWAPDLYDAVPTTITAWMTNIPKLAVLAFLLVIYNLLQPLEYFFILTGIGSLIVGSIGLGSQYRIKRFLAYSSISNLGFILLILAGNSPDSYIYYLVIYGITNVNIFAILLTMGFASNREIILISQLAGSAKLNAPLALALAISLFSLSGMPPIGGFFAKLWALQVAIANDWFWIAIIAIIASVVSAANYLQIIKVSHFDLPTYCNNNAKVPASISYIISICTIFLTFFILAPGTLLTLTTQFYIL